jgi:hypothetical protein
MIAAVDWVALGGVVVATLALGVSIWVGRRQSAVAARMATIEEARRRDEEVKAEESRQASLVADVRVRELRLLGGGARQSDRVRLTIENRGPAMARNIDAAIKDSEDRAPSAGLGNAVEYLDERGGYSGDSRLAYFQIPRQPHGPPPLEELAPDSNQGFDFWHTYRLVADVGILLTWDDGRGRQSARFFVHLNLEEATS